MSQDDASVREPEPRDLYPGRQNPVIPDGIATTDALAESAVARHSDWERHAAHTLPVETTEMGDPNLVPTAASRSMDVEVQPRAVGRGSHDEAREAHGPGGQQGDHQGRRRDADEKDRGGGAGDGLAPGQPRQQQPSMMTILLATAGLALVCGVLGAAGFFHFLGPQSDGSSVSSEKSEPGPARAATPKKKATFSGTHTVMESNSHGASWIPGFTSADDAETLRKQIANLAQRLDGLSERVDRMTRPKDETPPVLHTMQIKIAELAGQMDDLSALPAKVRQSDSRLDLLQEEFKTLRARIESLIRGQREGAATQLALRGPSGAAAAPSANGEDNSPTMDLAVTLLQRGQYAAAREVFARLQDAQPRDARVWYFAALAAGLARGNWDGEAKQLVEKGIECERHGTPSTAKIDSALATRVPIEGVPWLNSLRKQAFSAKHAP
jgi:TolA-binding protein